ncbi:MAG: hypothetical protein ABJZ55_01670 [Fuerstiella sp.]
MFEISKYIPELPVDSWWFFGSVLTALVVAIALVIRFVSSKTDDIDPVEVDRQMLSSVRELTRTGEITDDEYRSIKGRLVERLKLSEDEQKTSEDSQTSNKSPLSALEEPEDQKETDSAIQQDSNDSDSDQSHPTI